MKNLLIAIHCGGMPFDAFTVKNSSLGGSETAAHYLALELAKAGHEVNVFTNHPDPKSEKGGASYLSSGQSTEQCPLGENFHFWARSTPHDICIIQRAPAAFSFQFASKVNLLWLHDLALYRDAERLNSCLWNIDGILCVSEYHKQQVTETYRVPEKMVHVINNGIHYPMIKEAEAYTDLKGDVKLLYISRPERGLDELVRSGGIMEQLKEQELDYQLYVCCYNNIAQHMKDYYEMLWRKIDGMENVSNLGFLTKANLYNYMKSCDLLVYPTPGQLQPDFVEVSCIAAMEAMNCGLPMLTTKKGALPETCNGSGTVFAEKENFTKTITDIFETIDGGRKYSDLIGKQITAGKKYRWSKSASDLDELVSTLVGKAMLKRSRATYLKNKVLHSAISCITDYKDFDKLAPKDEGGKLERSIIAEIKECYDFYPEDSYSEHYKDYYEYEKARGVDYGPEDLSRNDRYLKVMEIIAHKIQGEKEPLVVDYGCAHGHYTINLARTFPHCKFIGVDICEDNVAKARAWARQAGISNVLFMVGDLSVKNPEIDETLLKSCPTVVIAAEVLEHVREPFLTFENLKLINPKHFVITTPFGPWEAQGYEEHYPWRAHIHDFTRPVIKKAFGDYKGFQLFCAPSGPSKHGLMMGSYIYTFENFCAKPQDEINNSIFNAQHDPLEYYKLQETLALVMLVGGDWKNLINCLDSVQGIIDEVVIALDTKNDTTKTKAVLEEFCNDNRLPLTIVEAPHPVKDGFDKARNVALSKVSADWVLWLDSDETLIYPQNVKKYLRTNVYQAYSIPQNHMSDDPPGLMTTDYPTKLFRNKKSFKFFGKVHEHPEMGLNKGTGHSFILPDVKITHLGYGTEETRRNRFMRNFNLLMLDYVENPTRKLNKFFVIRDMAQLLRYKKESGGRVGLMTEENIVKKAHKAWKECLETKNLRMIMESAKFYSQVIESTYPDCIKVQFDYKLGRQIASHSNNITIALRTNEEAKSFLDLVIGLQLEQLPGKYI